MSDYLQTTNDLNKLLVNHNLQKTAGGHQAPAEKLHTSLDKYNPAKQSSRVMGVIQERLYSFVGRASMHGSNNAHSLKAEAANEASKKPSENDFSPESVSRRIVGFVGNYMEKLKQSGASEERLTSVYEQSRAAVTKGLEDATEKLAALNWLNEGVQSNISETESQIFSGLDALGERFLGTAGTTPASDEPVQSPERMASVMSETQYERTSSTNIEIKTRDGDTVSLSLASLRAYQSSSSITALQSDSGSAMSASRYESSRSEFAFEYSLEGELDDAELEAINNLVNGLADVADEFFSGDMKAAFEQGMQLGYNTQELSGFAMELKYSESIRHSQMATAYGQSGGAAKGPGQSVIQPLRNYHENLSAISDKVQAQFQGMQEVVSKTMDYILEMRAQLDEKQQYIAELFDFNHQLLKAAFDHINPEASLSGTPASDTSNNNTPDSGTAGTSASVTENSTTEDNGNSTTG